MVINRHFRVLPGTPGDLAVEHGHSVIQGPQLRNEERQDRAGGFGDGAILFLNLRHQLGHVEEALRSHKSKLRKMAADCIDRLGPLANHEIAEAAP